MFGTLQDRLPKELKLAGIDTLEAANHWLSECYIADYNKRFAITAAQTDSAVVADALGAWREILCIQEDRTVGNDNTVKWEGLRLQLPPLPPAAPAPRTLPRLPRHARTTAACHPFPLSRLHACERTSSRATSPGA